MNSLPHTLDNIRTGFDLALVLLSIHSDINVSVPPKKKVFLIDREPNKRWLATVAGSGSHSIHFRNQTPSSLCTKK